MRAAGAAKAKEDTLASGAKPRLEERVRELGWRPTRENRGMFQKHAEAARRRPIERACRHLFAFSILYLFLLFATLLVERGWGGLIARLAACAPVSP